MLPDGHFWHRCRSHVVLAYLDMDEVVSRCQTVWNEDPARMKKRDVSALTYKETDRYVYASQASREQDVWFFFNFLVSSLKSRLLLFSFLSRTHIYHFVFQYKVSLHFLNRVRQFQLASSNH